MACCLFSAKPLTDPKLPYCQLDPRNKIQWNISRNSYIFIHENAFENVSKKFVAILSQSQCVKQLYPSRDPIGFWPEGTELLLEPILTYHQLSPVAFIGGPYHKIPKTIVTEFSLKMTNLKLILNPLGLGVKMLRKIFKPYFRLASSTAVCQSKAIFKNHCWIISILTYFFSAIKAPGDTTGNSSPPGQNGCHLGRRQFQMHFLKRKW